MTKNDDFFADLEQQLVAATTERSRRLRRARARRAATLSTILVALIAAGGGIAAAVTSTSSDDAARPAATTPPAVTTPPPTTSTTAPDPRTFEVAVLNGTTVPGLGRGVAMRLESTKHKIGVVTNAATQATTTTQIYYATPSCLPAAQEVAVHLNLPASSIHPATPGVRTIAGKRAKVIVLAGSDQNPASRRQP
jgi:hypothetical protein